jgi:hypothetical protein
VRLWPSGSTPGKDSARSFSRQGTTSKYNQLWSASVILLIIAVVIYGVIGALERVALARFGDTS